MAVPSLLQAYHQLVLPCTESPSVYHDWSFISSVAALLGRNVMLDFGFEYVYPNMYVCLLGPSAGRKSAAISVASKVLEGVGFNHFAKEKTSKEMFLSLLAKSFTTKSGDRFTLETPILDTEALLSQTEMDLLDVVGQGYICAGELLDFLGINDSPFLTLLTNLYDNKPKYEQPKLTGRDVYVNKPTINLLGGATPTTFGMMFPPDIIGGGLMSRMLLILGGGPRCRLTLPPPPDQAKLSEILEVLKVIKDDIRGTMQFTPEAFLIVDRLYKAEHPMANGRLESYVNRRHMHLNKLCMIFAAMDLQLDITAEHVVAANTILHDAELLMPQALGEFGLSSTVKQAESLMQALSSPQTVNSLYNIVSNDFDKKADFFNCITKLKETKKITVNTVTGKLERATNIGIGDKQMLYYEPSLLNYRKE